MYKIGEFSKITSLTAKALRYYDEEGILTPSARLESGYRLYDDKDYRTAQLIALLRELDFSIAEIKEVVSRCEDEEDLQCFLREKESRIALQMEREEELISRIRRRLTNKQVREENHMSYVIESKSIPAVTVAAIRFQGAYSDVGKYMGVMYKAVKGKGMGAPFLRYFDPEYKEIADLELCVPIRGTAMGAGVTTKQLPQEKGIATTHTGSYETLHEAYKAIFDWAAERGLNFDLPSRETYHKGPGMIFRGNPQKYVTEIFIPLKGE